MPRKILFPSTLPKNETNPPAIPVENKFHRQRQAINRVNLIPRLMKNVRQTAFQTLHDLLEATQRDALLALLQTMKRRGGKSELFGKLGKRHIAAFLAEKRSELFFQSVTHAAMLANNLFRLRNKLFDASAGTWKFIQNQRRYCLMKFSTQIVLVLFALVLGFDASATTFFVDVANSSPTAPFTNWPMAATDIQSAIDVAADGDLILVTNGIYQTGGRVVYGLLTNRVVISKAVRVQSVNGPAVTVIQGNSVIGSSAVRCVYMTNSSTLSGFTVTNGGTLNTGDQYQEMSGGGIWATNNTDAIITNCVLTGNVAYSLGGGAYSGNIISSMIVQNSAYQGGGMANSAATNSFVLSNSASAYGGGVSSATLKNCKVMSNLASFGGGAYSSLLYGCLIVGNQASMLGGAIDSGQITVNCTIVGNSSQQGAGGINGNAGSVVNNIIYSNTVAIGSTPNYSGISIMNNCCTLPLFAASGMSGGNITNDPGFVDFANGDFHLLTNSPCINSGGSPGPISSDLDGNPRLVDGFADIGAYENQNAVLVLPYLFAQQYVLPLDGSVDSDGDGMNNWQEAIAGTNPTNAASILEMLSVSNSVSGATVKWQSVSFKKYYLQRSTNLTVQPSFSSIQSNLSTFGTTMSFKDTTATNDGPYFYRVGVQ